MGISTSYSQELKTYVQKDFSEYIGYVISMTDKEMYSNDDYRLWRNYLNAVHPSVETTRGYFESASIEFDVPVELLMVIGQVENNWVQMGPSIDRGWGIMHLTDNSYSSTLLEAARLLDCNPQLLKDSAEYNIRGAAVF
jgi:membrane-bound lytic murein transglycosylase MltF